MQQFDDTSVTTACYASALVESIKAIWLSIMGPIYRL